LWNPPFDGWVGHASSDDYLVNYLYLIGLGDKDTPLSGGQWYENPPTAASYLLTRAKHKIMVVDMNLYFATSDNGFNDIGSAKWFYSNHARRARFDPKLVEIRDFVKGGHRLYTDGHVRWALADELARNDTAITGNVTNARYSHNGNDRPYFW
jgi:hypothetical protein